ncbi:MAG: hypothetical protein JWP89_4010 [Schlesneria sp.]|nr:hypothetical protein [Schlesneria sp.]
MQTFFHGWRRKMGCVTLVMALACMGAWIRSLATTDIFEFAKETATTDIIYSFDCSIVWIKVHQEWPDVKTSFQEWDTVPRTDYDFFEDDRITWFFRCCGIGVGKEVAGTNDWPIYFIVHYSTITLPLTVLSAYLILWKPRKPIAPTPPG